MNISVYVVNFTDLLELSTDRISLYLSPSSNTMKCSMKVCAKCVKVQRNCERTEDYRAFL